MTTTNRIRFETACEQARSLSLTDEYRGCSLHVNARIGMQEDEPVIIGYRLEDWTDGSTVASYVNGKRMWVD